MAGRPPKPTNLLELTGAFRKNPARKRARVAEPVSSLAIGGFPDSWMIYHPDIGFQRAEKLRAIWEKCMRMWPWLTYADRDTLEHYCQLKIKQDSNSLTAAEISALRGIRGDLGGTPSGRAKLGLQAGAERVPTKAKDPRVEFMKRKAG